MHIRRTYESYPMQMPRDNECKGGEGRRRSHLPLRIVVHVAGTGGRELGRTGYTQQSVAA